MFTGILDAITSPEKALPELKKQVKLGRDLIGRGQWQRLAKIENDIIEILEYLHNWRTVLTFDKLPYSDRNTDTALHLLKEVIREQTMFDYPITNVYGYTMTIGGDTLKKRELSVSWEQLEIMLGVIEQYTKEDDDENEGVLDKYGGMESESVPKDMLRGDEK